MFRLGIGVFCTVLATFFFISFPPAWYGPLAGAVIAVALFGLFVKVSTGPGRSIPADAVFSSRLDNVEAKADAAYTLAEQAHARLDLVEAFIDEVRPLVEADGLRCIDEGDMKYFLQPIGLRRGLPTFQAWPVDLNDEIALAKAGAMERLQKPLLKAGRVQGEIVKYVQPS